MSGWQEEVDRYRSKYNEALKEIKRLKKELREAKNKLYRKSRTINKMRDEDFDRVDFGSGRE